VTAAGGIRVTETAADVAVIGAIYSSYKNKALGGDLQSTNYNLQSTNNKLQSSNFNLQSSNKKNQINEKMPILLIGEVSLLGEVRGVKQMNKRKIESERMGRRLVEMKRIEELRKI
jgi:predicted ATP-dependent serine protease